MAWLLFYQNYFNSKCGRKVFSGKISNHFKISKFHYYESY